MTHRLLVDEGRDQRRRVRLRRQSGSVPATAGGELLVEAGTRLRVSVWSGRSPIRGTM
jgi:hypothetical protein